jgi:threonine dehydrogenase-like Zn-dependent dehydrogenase
MVIEDVSGPGRARAGHVIVRPERVGICGSDFHLFSGDVGAISGGRGFYPRVQGHEVSAIVEDPGDSTSCQTAADFSAAINLVAANRAAIAHVFSHHFPLARAAEAFAFALGRPADAVKIVVTVN